MLSGNIKKLELLYRSYPKIHHVAATIGKKTYEIMFKEHPETKELFAKTTPGQAQRLIDAVLFYCEETENFEMFFDRLDVIAHAHINAGVKPKFYPYMEEAFIQALRSILKNEISESEIGAWRYGFKSLAAELIHIENLARKN